MNKKLLTVAVAAAMAAPLAANAAGGPTVYGVAHAAVEHVDYDDTTGGATDNQLEGDYWRVLSRQSRLGVKGSEDLGGGLKAIYKMEFQIDISDTNGAGNVVSRNQYVGLSGNWGTFLMGRHDSPLKMMTISRDKFNTTLGDWNEVGGGSSGFANPLDNRNNNAIMYISPNFNGFTVAAQVTPGENGVDDDGINDNTTAIGAKYVNGPLYIGAGWEETEFQGDDAATNDDRTVWRVAGSYQIGDFNIGGMYEDQEAADFLEDDDDADIWVVNASYKFGNNVVKAQYQEGEEETAAGDAEYESLSVGLDHNFSKRTRAYAVYTDTDANDEAGDNSWDAFGLGLIHKF